MLCVKFLDISDKSTEKLVLTYKKMIVRKVLDIMSKLPVMLYFTRTLGMIDGNFQVNK